MKPNRFTFDRVMKKNNQEEGIQLNKYISNSGFCSRREADKLIEQFRVTVNGELALPAYRVMPGDVVAVDDEAIRSKQKPIYIALNKPVGITSTTDLSDRTNIISFMNHPKRIFPIGRLDKDSEGLILLTNDGHCNGRSAASVGTHQGNGGGCSDFGRENPSLFHPSGGTTQVPHHPDTGFEPSNPSHV